MGSTDDVFNPCCFTGEDFKGNSYFGCYCPEEQSSEYIEKFFNQEIKSLKSTIAKAQKSIALYERKLHDYDRL